jgi:hypothetical protein
MSVKSIDLSNTDGSFNFPAIAGRFLNCFHPSDPVSYRLEPFLSKHLTSHPPAYMMHYRYAHCTDVHTFSPTLCNTCVHCGN